MVKDTTADVALAETSDTDAPSGTRPHGFDQVKLSNALIEASSLGLSRVAHSTRTGVELQIEAIRRSIEDFNTVLSSMETVSMNVDGIHGEMTRSAGEIQETARELATVVESMGAVNESFQAVDKLLKTINKIADRTKLLALNATIEAATAGEAGKGFAVVANEVKELSHTTKQANEEISQTLEQIGESIGDLTAKVLRAGKMMEQAVAGVDQTRQRSEEVRDLNRAVSVSIQGSLENFQTLDQSASRVENEISELDVIGKTYASLTGLLRHKGLFTGGDNPLDRLAPLVEQSDFEAPERFAIPEEEYVLAEDDILISATNPKGVITFANNIFYECAQYEPGELVGRPHNVIRHPDMPKAAFADLWQVIRSGNIWEGFVANRGKLGRIYWVRAMVFPCFSEGKITGYISVRCKPRREDISRAVEIYRRLP